MFRHIVHDRITFAKRITQFNSLNRLNEANAKIGYPTFRILAKHFGRSRSISNIGDENARALCENKFCVR